MTELDHVSPAQLLLAAPPLTLKEGGAEGKGGAGIKGPCITGCYGIRLRRTPDHPTTTV